jgi:hypothetical protein
MRPDARRLKNRLGRSPRLSTVKKGEKEGEIADHEKFI